MNFGGVGSLRPGERAPAAAMALAIASVLVAYYLLKPARDTLFLAEASPERLPWVYMLAALVAAPAAALHAAAARRVSLGVTAVATLAVAAASLPPLWLLVGSDLPWAPYLLYSWAGIVGALGTSQLWLLAGAVFDASEAKRVFPLLSIGAILGAFVGGEATRVLVEDAGLAARDLLLAAAVALAFAAALTRWICLRWNPERSSDGARSRRRVRREPQLSTRRLSVLVLSSRHLRVFVGLVALAVLITTLVDYQFKTVAWNSFGDADRLAAFLGRFYGMVSLLSLVVQLLFSGRILKHLGVAGLLAALPVALLLGSAVLIVAPGLLAASLLRGGDLGLRHSLDRTGRELLLLPVPLELKKRTKLFIDVFVDRWFRGVAGALLLVLTAVAGLSVRGLIVPVLLLCVVWLWLVVLARREYAESFRNALRRRDIDPNEVTRHIGDDAAIEAIAAALRSGNRRRILYALSLAPAAERLDHADLVAPLLDHESRSVRTAALNVLNDVGARGYEERARTLMLDDDHNVRQAACDYLAGSAGDERGALIRRGLAAEDPRIRATVGRWIADHGADADLDLVEAGVLERLRSADHVDCRRAAARLLGRRATTVAGDRLEEMVADRNAKVACDAAAALARLEGGDARRRALALLADRRVRASVREALVSRGEAVAPDLVDLLEAEGTPMLVRIQAVKALGRAGGAAAAEALLTSVQSADSVLRERACMAMIQIRFRGEYRLPSGLARDLPLRRLSAYYGLFQARYRLSRTLDSGPSSRLLLRTLDEKLVEELRTCFMLLALRHPWRDIRNAWLGVHSDEKRLQASAAEYLEQILPPELRDALRPVTEVWPDVEVWEAGRDRFGHVLRNDRDALRHLMDGDDAWLRACAVWCAAACGDPELREAAVARRDDPSSVVREAAALAGA